MSNKLGRCGLFCILLLIVGINLYSDDSLGDAEKLLKNNPKEAVKLLKEKIKSKDHVISLRSRIRLSEYYDSQKKFKEVFKLLSEYESFSDLPADNKTSAFFPLEAYTENAFAKGADGGIYKGMKALDIARDRTKNLENFLVSYYYAKLLHYYSKNREALKHVNSALARGNQYFKRIKKEYDADNENDPLKKERPYWNYLKKKLRALKFQIDLAIFADTYGWDYALYKTARSFHLSGKFSEATSYYNRIIREFSDSQFSEAAKCYKIDTQLHDPSKSFTEIEREAKEFINSNPYALYRGEAAAVLGRYAMESQLDIKRAEKYYLSAYDFCERSRKLKQNEILFLIPEKIEPIGIIDEPFTSFDYAYFTLTRKIQPEEIINRETNKFYLDHLQKECVFMLGFVRFANGQYKEAEKLFDEVGKFDKGLLGLDSKNMPNAIARLRGACKQGFFYLTDKELKYFKGKARLKLLLADFYFALEFFKKAYGIYNEIQKSGTPLQQSLALIRKGDCECFMREPKKAEKSFKASIKLARKQKEIQLHAIYSLGCLMDSQGGKYEDAKKYLKLASVKGKKTYYGRQAHYRLITSMALRGSVDEAEKEYEDFCKIYSGADTQEMKKFFSSCKTNRISAQE